jgi:hypothetical protein
MRTYFGRKPGKKKSFLRSEVDTIYLYEHAYIGASEVEKISYVKEVLPSFGNQPICTLLWYTFLFLFHHADGARGSVVG